MSKHKKNGFTLVELLAVIVILAIILVIAVPSIISTINESKKGVLESSAKLIASTAESAMISNQTLGISGEISCEDVSNYNTEDYECSIKVLGNTPYVTLIGKGKFEGESICYASKEGGVKVQGSVCPPLAVEKIENLFNTAASANGLFKDDTIDTNIRYTGASPKNYIKFNNEDWRIIGLFEVKTADGSTEKLMKIVRDSVMYGYSWDSSTGNNNGTHEDGEVNDGLGVNQWGASTYTNGEAYEGADLMRELNTLYLNQGSGKCFNGTNNAYTACNFSTTGIKDTYRGMIESVVWNTGGVATHASGRIGQSSLTAYNEERGTTTGQICKGTTYLDGAWCTDEVTRTTTWEGRVGLIYPSDYGYASTNTSCRANINDSTNYSCKNDNWLHSNTYYWTLSPNYGSGDSLGAWLVDSNGNVHNSSARDGAGFRSSVYLRSNVSITSGDGSRGNPYQLGMN